MQAALNLSRKRADAVKNSVIAYAKGKGIAVICRRFSRRGGIAEPFIAKPSWPPRRSRTCGLSSGWIRVSAEVTQESDFDF